MRPIPPGSLTMAIYPTARGFGWAAFESPFAPYDWGRTEIKKNKNTRALEIISRLLDRLQPETVVLEAFDKGRSERRGRVAKLCRAICNLACDRGIDVAIYTRADIRKTFAPVGASTRHQIAQAVGRHVSAFSLMVPKPRKPWEPEDRRMALFNAVALILVHYQLDAQQFLERLKSD